MVAGSLYSQEGLEYFPWDSCPEETKCVLTIRSSRLRRPGGNLYQDLIAVVDRNRTICNEVVENVQEGRSPLLAVDELLE
jgi:hypothetical protein